MDLSLDKDAIFAEIANQRMGLGELKVSLSFGVFQKSADITQAERFGKLAGEQAAMNLNLFQTDVEQPDLALIPARPDLLADIFRGRGVIGLGHFDVGVPVDGTLAFRKDWE